jgi:hypothetical protein
MGNNQHLLTLFKVVLFLSNPLHEGFSRGQEKLVHSLSPLIIDLEGELYQGKAKSKNSGNGSIK